MRPSRENMNDTTKLENLEAECSALEEEAEITAQMERAREGRLIPLGAFGEDTTPDAYFADEFDHFRERARDAYFSVEDVDLRRKLITIRRRIDAHISRAFEADMEVARQTVSAARSKSLNQPWGAAGFWAVATVAVGYWAFDLVGAIGGAVLGFFSGQGVIANAKRAAQMEFEHAEKELEQLQKYQEIRALHPECFGIQEECTGVRDEQLDWQSAYGNVLQSRKNR